MAAIDDARLEAYEVQEMVSARDVKTWAKIAFWSWFLQNRDDVVFSIGIWKLKKNIRIGDLQPVFERFFGTFKEHDPIYL